MNLFKDNLNYNYFLSREENILIISTPHLSYLISNKEIEELQNYILETKKLYKDRNITDDYIRSFNDERDRNFKYSINQPTQTPKKEPVRGYVYLMQNTKTKSFKIGFSKNPKSRLKSINQASEHKIILLDSFKGYYEDEYKTHEIFNFFRKNSEWFSFSESIVEYFKEKRNGNN